VRNAKYTQLVKTETLVDAATLSGGNINGTRKFDSVDIM
jgi:hypothetical protein